MNFFFRISALKSTFMLRSALHWGSFSKWWAGASDANERNANGDFDDTPKISKRPDKTVHIIPENSSSVRADTIISYSVFLFSLLCSIKTSSLSEIFCAAFARFISNEIARVKFCAMISRRKNARLKKFGTFNPISANCANAVFVTAMRLFHNYTGLCSFFRLLFIILLKSASLRCEVHICCQMSLD